MRQHEVFNDILTRYMYHYQALQLLLKIILSYLIRIMSYHFNFIQVQIRIVKAVVL